MNITKLKQFLVKAKKNTYASGGENKARVMSSGAKEYIFNDGYFKYVDRYSGHKEFVGKENILQDDKIVWRMKYTGGILSNKIPADDIYSFLRNALRKIPEEKPFRGPKKFIDKSFKYINNIQGDIENFSGEEKIFYKDELVYNLTYSGETIK